MGLGDYEQYAQSQMDSVRNLSLSVLEGPTFEQESLRQVAEPPLLVVLEELGSCSWMWFANQLWLGWCASVGMCGSEATLHRLPSEKLLPPVLTHQHGHGHLNRVRATSSQPPFHRLPTLLAPLCRLCPCNSGCDARLLLPACSCRHCSLPLAAALAPNVELGKQGQLAALPEAAAAATSAA